MQAAGAFAVVLEMVPAGRRQARARSSRSRRSASAPDPDTDTQVLVWSDIGHGPGSQAEVREAVRRLGEILLGAARAYADEVRAGSYPDAEHLYTSGEG